MSEEPLTPIVAVGAVVLSGGRLLMVKRARPPAEGLWTVPGGRVESGETLSQAVAREVREETGLEVEVGELLGVFEVIGEDHHYVILDHVAEPTDGSEPSAASDAEEARWVPLEEVGDLSTTPRLVEMLTSWGVLRTD